MSKSYSPLTIFSIAVLPLSCSAPIINQPEATQNDHHIYIQCTEPRPEICTREYNPVCATLNTGKENTYATGCTACAEHAVEKYRQGSCEQ